MMRGIGESALALLDEFYSEGKMDRFEGLSSDPRVSGGGGVVYGEAYLVFRSRSRPESHVSPLCLDIPFGSLRLVLVGELFFRNFPKFGNNWRYVSRYGGVPSLFVK